MDEFNAIECTTLVPIHREQEPRQAPAHAARPDASFVAHLIATASGSPQTRTLRRGTFSEALGGYQTVRGISAKLRPANSNRVFRVA